MDVCIIGEERYIRRRYNISMLRVDIHFHQSQQHYLQCHPRFIISTDFIEDKKRQQQKTEIRYCKMLVKANDDIII